MSDDRFFAPEPPEEERADHAGTGEVPVAGRHGGHAARRAQHGGGRRRGRSVPGCLAALVALVVVVAVLGLGGTKGYHYIKDHLSGSGGDYAAGEATGHVQFTVQDNENGTQMGRDLKDLGVVKSVDAFIGAYEDNPDSVKIGPGTYKLQKQMASSAVITALLDHNNMIQSKVLIPEGLRASDIAATLGKKTKYSASAFQKVLNDPSQLGLPSYANGKVEGYLFPATYDFQPGEKPVDMLKDMVAQWKQHAQADGLESGAAALGYTPQQVMTVASLVQEEGKTPSDMAKIARVIYNRIEHHGAEGTAGFLQVDATVDYALNRPLTVGLTQDERDNTNSPYNTYTNQDLPPGPIASPGDAAIKAALHPTPGDWYYYITVNLATGKTEFAQTYQEFLHYKQEHDTYCATQSASGCQ